MMHLRKLLLLTAVMALSLAAQGGAVEKRTLPEIKLVSSRGLELPAREYAATGHRLWVLLSPSDKLSQRLLSAYKSWPTAEWRAGTVFVIQSTPEEARLFVEEHFGDESEVVQWASDEKRATARSLALSGSPVLIALDQTSIEWTISGVLSDPQTLHAVVSGWLKSDAQTLPAKL
jgi:hypothetical protein